MWLYLYNVHDSSNRIKFGTNIPTVRVLIIIVQNYFYTIELSVNVRISKCLTSTASSLKTPSVTVLKKQKCNHPLDNIFSIESVCKNPNCKEIHPKQAHIMQ